MSTLTTETHFNFSTTTKQINTIYILTHRPISLQASLTSYILTRHPHPYLTAHNIKPPTQSTHINLTFNTHSPVSTSQIRDRGYSTHISPLQAYTFFNSLPTPITKLTILSTSYIVSTTTTPITYLNITNFQKNNLQALFLPTLCPKEQSHPSKSMRQNECFETREKTH